MMKFSILDLAEHEDGIEVMTIPVHVSEVDRLAELLGHVLKNGRLEDDEMADARAALAGSGPEWTPDMPEVRELGQRLEF